ncbi:TerB family tellurite resistance protein [Brevibacillus borstelensis]
MYTKTEKDKHILFASIRLIICVGHADGYIGNKEVSRIHELVNSEHFTLRERQILMDDMDYPKRPETIVKDMVDLSLSEKLGLLRQLYKIALVDHKLSLAETLEIRRISCLLGIPEEKQRQVEEWIVEGIQWRDRWKDIVGE